MYLFWAVSFLFSERCWLEVGRLLGVLVGYFHPRTKTLHARLIALNLHGAVSVNELWGDLGRRLFEAVRLNRTSARFALSPQAKAVFDSVQSRDTGALVLSAHFGHWEAMGVALHRLGFSYSAVSTQGKRDPINRLIQSRRQALGVQVIDRPDSARAIVEQLRAENSVALFVDVPSNRRSLTLDFLGRSVVRSTIVNRLRTLSSCPVIFVFNQRDDRGDYRIYAEEIPHDVDLIKWSHRRLEELVCSAPAQWVWLLE